MANLPDLKIHFPPKMVPVLFEPHRYKVFYGGRAGARSWSFARALLLRGLERPTRILCAREVQNSIKDSVHKLLRDQIQLMGLGKFYRVLETEIRGSNGTEFTFIGLSVQTEESIKSYESYDICWVEEARNVKKSSWTILFPTIRKDESEIWVSFNPELESDYTYQYFVVNPPPGCVTVLVNYMDNPWFNDILEAERLHCQKTDPDNYPNIWLGECKPAVEGAIYFKQVQSAEKNGQICRLPYDPMLKTHVVIDLGFGHFMSVGCVQKHLSEIRIIDYFQVQGSNLPEISQELKKRPYNWGKVYPPHDAFSADAKLGITSASILRKLGWTVPERRKKGDPASADTINELGVEEGIRLVKQTFPQIYFDSTRCGDVCDERSTGGMVWGGLIECLKRYRRRMNQATGFPGSPVQDEFTDGADFLRYVCVNAALMTNDEKEKRPRTFFAGNYTASDSGVGY